MLYKCPFCNTTEDPIQRHLEKCERSWIKFSRLSKATEPDEMVTAPRRPDLSDAKARRLTFSKVECWRMPVSHLVDNGFYYTGEGDIVACFWCKRRVGYWMPDDDALEKHVSESPGCLFARNLRDAFLAQVSFAPPRNIHLIRCSSRLETFDKWPLNMKRNLAQNGYYYANEEVKCFWCDYRLKNPRKASRLHPDCKYSSCHHEKGGRDEADETLKCKVCFQGELRIAFLDCGHVSTCKDCANKVKTCPICQRSIKKRVTIFIS